ncbi:MAG: c-type cytochrome biogenesis protein CcmI [Thiobacillus sp.]|uniref:c-type cytochrome biogenesis protein CcmI n=1 Tax=Thiobacillus sp. TaxID=924 RepID=UPI0028961084|nr:c-type cytochrome biogenesis protein CcmI [Thiobacillus sp.]MDT3705493.1 c-type cytochrome biogenesis protein CcmI [Thiobacillus sp.]
MSPFWSVSLFWIVAVACVATALAFVLPALMRTRSGGDKAARRDVNIAVYRDQVKEMDADRANGLLSEEQYAYARQELEARLADDALAPEAGPATGRVGSRRLGVTLAVVLPAAAFALYFWLGNPAALVPGASAPGAMAGAEQDFTQLIRQVEDKTRANPADGEAWVMLARSYVFVGRWPDAVAAFEKAAALLPQEASVLTGLAEAQAMASNGVLSARSMELVQQALALDPNDTKGLELTAVHAFQEQDFATAAASFKRLHDLLPPDASYAREILDAQREAERLAGLDATQPSAAPGGAVGVPATVIRGRVDIAPALKSALRESDVLFLFARPGEGGPPVAAIRARAGELPLAFELGDDAAMNPDNPLSRHEQVTLVARLSKSGNPIAQPGDLEGRVADVAVGSKGVKLVIDEVLP